MSFARLAVIVDGDVSPLAAAADKGKAEVNSLANEVKKVGKAFSQDDLSKTSGIASAIQQQKHALAEMRGTYDRVTAAAIDFKAKGAPNSMIAQYVSLRREIDRTTQSERQAAQAARERDAANNAYAQSQMRLEAQRQAAIRSNAVASQASQSRGGMGGMAGGMMFPMAMNSLAVGFQDAVSVYQVNKSMLSAISAAGNNVIFLLTLMNPMAGALGAITIGLTQLGVAWFNSGSSAEESAEKQKAATDKITESLKDQAALRNMLAEGDVKGIDSEVNTLSGDVKSKERELEFLKKKTDAAYKARDGMREGTPEFARTNEQIDAAEERTRAAQAELNDLRTQLQDAKDVQEKLTPWQRKVQEAKDGKFDAPLDDLGRMRDETKLLTGQETELQQRQRKLREEGMSEGYIGKFTTEFEANRIAKEADAAKKKTEQENEIAARKKESDEERRNKEAEQVKESVKSPYQKASEETNRLYGLFKEGRLSSTEATAAMETVRKNRNRELMQDMPDRVSHAQSLVKGSVEAARVAQTGRSDEKLMQIAQQSLTVQRTIATNTGKTNSLAKPRTVGRT